MLLELFLSVVFIFALLLITEALWRLGKLHIETSRKIVHIGTGVLVAFWPYYLSWTTIQLLSLALLYVIVISYKFHIFKSIHSIKRLTIGEILYPVGIGLCALLEPSPWVFTIAILNLTLADGFAAIIGIKYGAKNRYAILSHGKSIAGSFAFFAVSFGIFVVASFLVDDNELPHQYGYFILAAGALTLVENISWYGLDDITVPLGAIVILALLP